MFRRILKWIAVCLCSLVIVFGIVYAFFPGITLYLASGLERGQAGLSQKQQLVDELSFSYLEGGEGEPLLLLHGFAANKDNWTRISSYLSTYFHLIIPDLPGFGESGNAPDGNYRLEAQAKRLKAFMDSLGIRQFHLGGSSMGGYLAGVYAARYPASVKSLLLVSPSGVFSAQASELDNMLAQGQHSPLQVETAKDYGQLLDFVFFERPFIPEAVKQLFAEEALAYRPLHDQILSQLNQDTLVSLEDLLKGVSIPTRIVWGKQDRVLHVSGAETLADILPNSKVHIMEKTGHLPMVEHPKEVAKAYLQFHNISLE